MPWSSPQVRDLVIRTLIGEGAAGDPDSWASVANVLKNRALTGAYGDPNAGALTKTIQAPKQFSMWNPGMNSSGRTISPDHPNYIRAGQIADSVFNGGASDNTGGADHYYAPSGMAGGHAPSWAIGQTPTATIGGQHFFKLGLSNSDAVNQGHTSAGPIVGGGGSSGGGGASGSFAASPIASLDHAAAGAISRAVADAHALLGKNEVPDHDMLADYLKTGGQNLDPHQSAWCAAFVSASLQREGLPVPGKIVKDSQFAGGANARDYLTYGQGVTDPNTIQAGDILVAKDGSHVGFAEGPVRQGANGPEVQILAGNEADRSGQYAPGSWTNPQTGQTAGRSQVGQVGERWAPVSDFVVRRAGSANDDAAGPASSAAPAAAASAPIPAAAAQPTSATAPGSSGGNFAIPPAGSSAGFPGSDKVSLVQSMTTGTSHNPQITTAANWGNLFGGAPPVATPAAPAAAAPVVAPGPASPPVAPPGSPLTPVQPDLSKDAPIGATGPPMPFLPNPFDNPAFPPPAPKPMTLPPLSPADFGAPTPSSVRPATGTTATYSDDNETPAQMPGGMGRRPAWTPGQPSMGFPAQTNPFGDQTSMNLPGSMMASAQNLIKLLFPSSVG